MNDRLSFALVWGAGLALGTVFFGGLWWTVRRGMVSKHPAVVFFASLLLRTGMVVAGFYLASAGNWTRLLVCLFGFVVARGAVTWLTRPPLTHPICPAREANHAP